MQASEVTVDLRLLLLPCTATRYLSAIFAFAFTAKFTPPDERRLLPFLPRIPRESKLRPPALEGVKAAPGVSSKAAAAAPKFALTFFPRLLQESGVGAARRSSSSPSAATDIDAGLFGVLEKKLKRMRLRGSPVRSLLGAPG